MEAKDELALRRQFDEAQRHALADPAKAVIARIALQSIIDGTSEVAVTAKVGRKTHKGKHDLAQVRRTAVEAAFHKRGHIAVVVPKPAASNRDFARWEKENRALFYHPADSQMTYEVFMASVGQCDHWTVVDEAQRAEIGWEPTQVGYWFLAQVAPFCPRLNTSRNDLTGSIKLLSLKEYAIAYWLHRDQSNVRIDVHTWCWLRTCCGLSALDARDYVGEVSVRRLDAAGLAIPYPIGGGRAVEVIKNAA